MTAATSAASHEYALLDHKVSFDHITKIITVNDGVTDLDIQVDIYSDWKEWFNLYENSGKANLALRSIGGDPTIQGEFAGDIYFTQNGWRISYDPRKVRVDGVLFSDDFDTPWVSPAAFNYEPIYPAKVASLVTKVAPTLEGLSIPSATEVAAAVWDYSVDLADDTAGSIGAYTRDHLHDIHYIERSVWVDESLVAAGDGSQSAPFNSITNAIDFAESEGINLLRVHDDITLDRQLKNFRIEGVGTPTIDANSQNLDGCEFFHVKMDGAYTGVITVQESVLLNNFWLNGYFENCGLAGDLFCIDNSSVLLKDCTSVIPGLGRPTISMNGAGWTKLSVRSNGGGMTIKDCNNALDEVTVEVREGSLTFDSSCTDGAMVARGMCKFVDETNGATVTDETGNPANINISNKLLKNRTETDPATGVMTVYDEDDITVLFTANIWENVTATTPYAGNAVNRRERFE